MPQCDEVMSFAAAEGGLESYESVAARPFFQPLEGCFQQAFQSNCWECVLEKYAGFLVNIGCRAANHFAELGGENVAFDFTGKDLFTGRASLPNWLHGSSSQRRASEVVNGGI